MPYKLKLMLFACCSTFLGLTTVLILAEIVLRFFPVNEGLHSLPVNHESPIARWEPHRTSVWSRYWNFSMVNIVKTNNYGFISNIDYDPRLNSPLIALIGDSYIKAVRVPWEQTGTARLQQLAGSDARVYAFSASGAPLSQYLAYAEYVTKEFNPEGLVILVVGNDFDESLIKYKSGPGFHYFVASDRGELILKRVDFEVKLWRRLVRKSALGMYLATNLNVSQIFSKVKNVLKHETFVGNTSASTETARVEDSKRAVDAFLKMLPEMSRLDPSNILLVLDGMRPELYNENRLKLAEGSYYGIMRRYFMKQAEEKSFEVIDMQPVFIEHYKKYGQRFEFPNDGHWNSLGYEVFADVVAKSKVFSLLSDPK